MALKRTISPEEIVEALNSAISKSTALDGDCRECRVRRVHAVLVDIALAVGKELDAYWS